MIVCKGMHVEAESYRSGLAYAGFRDDHMQVGDLLLQIGDVSSQSSMPSQETMAQVASLVRVCYVPKSNSLRCLVKHATGGGMLLSDTQCEGRLGERDGPEPAVLSQ